MTQAKNSLAEFLRTSRIDAGLSQRNVSKTLGYRTSQFISNWERGVSLPPGRALRQIAEIYEIQTEMLYDRLFIQAACKLEEGLHREVFGTELKDRREQKG
jgi:transcriptional regulator with XRE-family HTH domain